MVRLHQCGFIGWESIGQAIDVQLVSFHIVRSDFFHDIIGHIYTDAGYPPNATFTDKRKCKVTAKPIERGRFLEDSVLRVERFGNVILPYAQSQQQS